MCPLMTSRCQFVGLSFLLTNWPPHWQQIREAAVYQFQNVPSMKMYQLYNVHLLIYVIEFFFFSVIKIVYPKNI